MGHCCLSRERVHHSSQLGVSEEEEEASMMVGKISSALFTKQPLPSYAQTHALQSCHVYHLKPCRALNSAQPPTVQSPTKEKMTKKVTFAKDLVQIYPSSHQPISREAEEVSQKAPKKEARRSFLSGKDMRAQREGQMKEEVKEGAVSSCNNLMKEAATSGVVRVKVVISKKQLSELLKSSTPSSLLRKQTGDAVMQKVVAAPLLPQLIARSPQIKCSAKSRPSWRPSLDGIPEAFSTQELFI